MVWQRHHFMATRTGRLHFYPCGPLILYSLLLYAFLTKASNDSYLNDTALRLNYGGITNWAHFSTPADVRAQCADGIPLRIAYFTRHTGTLWDWIAIAAHLHVPWTRVNPGLFLQYGINASSAARVWHDVGHVICHMADILIFSDTIPDARPLLQGGCQTPIVLQVTNRFDFEVLPSDLPSYVALLSEVARRPHVWWVSNNPYEEEYMVRRGVKLPPAERRMMLRPVGTCLLPDAAPPTSGEGGGGDAAAVADATIRVAMILPPYSRHLENTFIMPWLLRHGLTAHVQVYRQHYGGPSVLARHRGVITVPYQTSVMKMYEGLAAGAVFVIPSPELFATLVRELDLHRMSFCCRDLLRNHPDDWPQFMDWYHPDFVSAHVLYDNLKDLKRFLTDHAWSSQLVSERRRIGTAAMAASRERTLDGYGHLLRAVSQQVCAATTPEQLRARGAVFRAGKSLSSLSSLSPSPLAAADDDDDNGGGVPNGLTLLAAGVEGSGGGRSGSGGGGGGGEALA
ncbi:hypothetical protein VaNZ11_009238 [Volvox africanus]|uniref:Uncharacterized protein n=1 Tax=Volvox africanus TaxID=51714 RepID=A0ABQ5S781_9CHLO|nr:hypothetical protein VaNZ11_009238 [Volvox africanus]